MLLVDDHVDVRDLVALALRNAGYVVAVAGSGAEGLRLLETDRYAVVIAHYGMPAQNGFDMLKRAQAMGWLEGTAAIVLSAQPDVGDVVDGAYPLLAKPVDPALLVEQVRALAAPAPQMVEGGTRPPARVEITLYYTPPWPASVRARNTLAEVVERYRGEQIIVTLCDLGRDPEQGEKDKVVFSPTLVKRSPGAPVWVLGDLGNGDTVADLLELAGVERRT